MHSGLWLWLFQLGIGGRDLLPTYSVQKDMISGVSDIFINSSHRENQSLGITLSAVDLKITRRTRRANEYRYHPSIK